MANFRYLRRKPAFKHEPITQPGLYDIREYDPDEIDDAEEDNIPFEDVAPMCEFQILVFPGPPGTGLAYSVYSAGATDGLCSPVEIFWNDSWLTQRLVAKNNFRPVWEKPEHARIA